MKNIDGMSVEDCLQVNDLMNRKFGAKLDDRFFETEVETEEEAVSVKVTLRNDHNSFFYPVEGRMKNVDQGVTAREAGLFLLDYVFLYFEEYFRDDDTFLPIDWANYSKEGYDFQMRGQILNLHLEKLADDILAGKGFDREELARYQSGPQSSK